MNRPDNVRRARRLEQLRRALTVGGSSGVLAGLGLVVPIGIVLLVLVWAAILFAPYMLWRLFQDGRYGWIAGFVAAVGVPFLYGRLVDPEGISGYVFTILPLLTFYGYTWLLRAGVDEWLEELQWKPVGDDQR